MNSHHANATNDDDASRHVAMARPPARQAAVRARARIRDYTERVVALQQGPLAGNNDAQQLPPMFDEFGFLESDPEDDDYDPSLSESDSELEDDDSELEDGSSMDEDDDEDEDEETDETDELTDDE